MSTRETQPCEWCGRPLDQFDHEVCELQMALSEARDYRTSKSEKKQAAREKIKEAGKGWKRFQYVIIIICVSIIAINMPRCISVLKGRDPKPLRKGTYSTDSGTDQCIENLWTLSKLIQQGKLSDHKMICPESNKYYLIDYLEEDIAARCPDPRIHGFAAIRVSQKRPVPELVE